MDARSLARARALAGQVPDPEIPVLTIDDLGVLRGVEFDASGTVVVRITPTYSGCPAIEAIAADITESLECAGFDQVRVDRVLAPAWTTDWISEEGRRKLLQYGIAPPGQQLAGSPVPLSLGVRCPQCSSTRTAVVSEFGATACKSLWKCRSCREMFEHFKHI